MVYDRDKHRIALHDNCEHLDNHDQVREVENYTNTSVLRTLAHISRAQTA